MRFVPTKTPEQQSCLMLHRTRHLFIRQQTAVINSIRAHLAELGIIAPVGRKGVMELLQVVADPSDKGVPEIARACLAALGNQLLSLKEQILEFDRMIMAWHRSNEPSKRLRYIPSRYATSIRLTRLLRPRVWPSARASALRFRRAQSVAVSGRHCPRPQPVRLQSAASLASVPRHWCTRPRPMPGLPHVLGQPVHQFGRLRERPMGRTPGGGRRAHRGETPMRLVQTEGKQPVKEKARQQSGFFRIGSLAMTNREATDLRAKADISLLLRHVRFTPKSRH